MYVYDPVRRVRLQESDVETLDRVGVFVPFRPKGETYWLALIPWTNETRRIADLPEYVRADVEKQIAHYEVVQGVLARCAGVREFGRTVPLDESEADRILAGVVDHDQLVAVQVSRAKGFSSSEIAFALDDPHDDRALNDALDGVEVVSVGQIVEEMRARD